MAAKQILLNIVAASALVQPHVDVSAQNLLADLRRTEPTYYKVASYVPRYVTIRTRVYYPAKEISKYIVSIEADKAKHPGS
jgi:hypothetical protein